MATGRKPRRPMSKAELAVRSPVWMASKRAPMQEDAQAKLVVRVRMAFHRITLGEGDDTDSADVANAANIAMVLCEMEHGAEYLPRVLAAQDAIVTAQHRANAGQGFTFDAPGRQAVLDMLDLYEQQVNVATHEDVMRALATCADRMRAGHAVEVRPITR